MSYPLSPTLLCICGWLLALLPGTCVRAQSDYQLFRPGVQYLYERAGVEQHPYDFASQYYGLRIDAPGCASLYNTLGGYHMPTIEVCEVAFAFGSSVCQTADSTIMYDERDRPFVLYQRAGVGERWLAFVDGPYRIMAEVNGIDSATVLGLPDTIKRIAFSTEAGDPVGAEIGISRRYGLVTGIRFHQVLFESGTYELAGMDSPSAGRQLPDPKSYGLAAVGDSFQIESYNFLTPPFGSPTRFGRRYSSFTILEVDTTQTGIYAYRARGSFYEYTTGSTKYTPVHLDTVFDFTIDRLPPTLAAMQPGQTLASPLGDDVRSLIISKAFEDPCGLIRLRTSTPVSLVSGQRCGLDASHVDGGPGPVYTQFVPVRLDSISGQSGPQWAGLRYLRSGDRRCGTFVDPTELSVATHGPPTTDNILQVFPNPVGAGLLTVGLTRAGPGTYLILYDPVGREVGTWKALPPATTLSTEGLPSGIYTLVVGESGAVLARRRIVIH